jgi:hypothetical protein
MAMKLTSGKLCFGDGVDPSDTYAQLMIGTTFQKNQ